MTQPTVTVIVPVRNGTKVLSLCVNAMKAQTYPAELFEIIVVDDESTDATAVMTEDTIAEWSAQGVKTRLRLIRKT